MCAGRPDCRCQKNKPCSPPLRTSNVRCFSDQHGKITCITFDAGPVSKFAERQPTNSTPTPPAPRKMPHLTGAPWHRRPQRFESFAEADATVRRHHAANAAAYHRLGVSADKLAKAFHAAYQQDNTLTAADFLQGR